MMAALESLKTHFQLRQNRIFQFQPQFPFKIELGPYTLKTAENADELMESFKLRHEVFNIEFRGVQKGHLDFDRFDSFFDHLLIFHGESKKVIGTYRVNKTNSVPEDSYTGLEFHLTGLTQYQGPYLELGRACIAKEHRRGAVITLLWRGIAEYMKMSGVQTLFGCSSLKVNNSKTAALIYRYLEDKKLVTKTLCQPTKAFQFSELEEWLKYYSGALSDEQINEAEKLIPPLLKSYLKLGSKIMAHPAFDRDFDCLDFLTVLNRHDLSQTMEKKFLA